MKSTGVPAETDWLFGCVVMIGAADGVTVRVAAELVTLPAAVETTLRY